MSQIEVIYTIEAAGIKKEGTDAAELLQQMRKELEGKIEAGEIYTNKDELLAIKAETNEKGQIWERFIDKENFSRIMTNLIGAYLTDSPFKKLDLLFDL